LKPKPEPIDAPKVRPDREGPLHVELILVGRDLLRGQVEDANARFLAGRLSERGALVHRMTFVDDKPRAVAAALLEALGRSPGLVVTTGGLGPAADDVTLEAVAAALGRPLTPTPVARSMIEAAYQKLYEARRISSAGMNLAREKLCRLPVGCDVVPNERGISPGVICRLPGGTAVLCLPGTPREARAVLESALESMKGATLRGHVARREVESPTGDESALRPMIDVLAGEFPYVWISSRPVGMGGNAKVLVTLEATGHDPDEAEKAVEGAVKRLLALAAGSR
jgi:molybdenum cofactor synthesis domain-containing protein